MKTKSSYRHFEVIIVLILITVFFKYRLNEISYGLPYFWNQDEIAFQGSILSSLSFLTGYFEFGYNPFYAPFFNIILILNSVFINEFLINSLTLQEIKSKIYFNTELFIFYGRLASLIISSFSVFFIYLIFKKLKINFLISITLLMTFITSMALLNVSNIMGKNSSYLLIYLIQLYFFIKYQLKINRFNFKSYLIFGILGSLAWGVNYWPAFVSIYAVFALHIIKFKFSKINYFLFFIIFFILFGPIANLIFTGIENLGPIHWINPVDRDTGDFILSLFLQSTISDIIGSFKIIFLSEKNILLLILISPIFFLNKLTKFKKEFLIIIFLIIEPIILISISDRIVPSLRYFVGVNSIILILTGLIFNELHKVNSKYFTVILVLLNIYFISENIKKNNDINNTLVKNHSFLNFNENIKIDRSKVLYLVDLNFQESLKQNSYYLRLYNNNLIEKSESSKKFLDNIKQKIKKIKNSKNIIVENEVLKKDMIYFNYSYFPIKNLELFFNFIKKDFEYVVIEESRPFYLSYEPVQNKIKTYVKENFILDHILYEEDKIFLNNQQSVVHYYAKTTTVYDDAENIDNDKLDVIYGMNYSLYKLK